MIEPGSTLVTTPLKGAKVAFTGKLLSMSRRAAHDAVRRCGGEVTTTVSRRTSLLVVGMGGWPLLPDGQVSAALHRAEHFRRHGSHLQIISEDEFLERVGRKPVRHPAEKTYDAEELCALTGIQPEQLRRWEQLSLVRSYDGRFDFQDLVSLRTLADLIGQGATPEAINRSLRGLAAVLPGVDRPLAQLEIVMENRDSLLADLHEYRIAADGQLMLSFDAPTAARTVAFRLQQQDELEDADAWLERGQLLEEEERWEEAARAYRTAIGLEPNSPEALFNLGNVLRALQRTDAARELYLLALAIDPTLSEAWYNLADICDESGRLDLAIDYLLRAVAVAPGFADAHYNLALCYERLGQEAAARRHWQEYLKHDSDSDWAAVARHHLSGNPAQPTTSWH